MGSTLPVTVEESIMIDALPVLPTLFLAFFAGVTWLAIEFRHAAPDPYPDDLSALDVLQLTGKYPHGGAR